ncbi:glutaredoxin family protein [Thiobacter aerophilum]|uniref:Glutaredoxin family protein n=1 Tax=Thiobacter aerophilum TaxID=3121275 RepID=A0ABV0ECJ9_9BURK
MRSLLVLFFFAAAAVSAGELYRWVDREGRVHYSDAPPPPNARQVEEKRMPTNTASGGDLPYATRRAAAAFPVTLFVSDCGDPCNQARAHLSRRGIPYTVRNPAANQADAEALSKLVGSPQVPVLVVGKRRLTGYDAAAWDVALDAAGYPKSRPHGYKEPPLPKDAPAATQPAP